MLYSIIPKSKFGLCSVCGTPDTECVKLQKSLVCLNCRGTQKAKIQIQKANEKNKIRGLQSGLQKEIGVRDSASRQNLINDLDYVFSRIIRLREADEYMNCVCYTCGSRKHWSLMQCGHFQKRGNMGLRYDFRNSRVQDKTCNEGLGGNLKVYKQKLEEESPGLSEQLELEAREVFKYSNDELKQLLFDLRQKLKPLEQKIKK